MDLTTIGFDYGEMQVRIIMIQEEPWFMASDLCKALDHSDTSMAVKRLDDDEKLTQTMFVSGQHREVWLVNEPGLYKLVMTSRKPEAKQFDRWVRHVVLPSIRKTGQYIAPSKRTDEIRWNEAEAKVRNARARQAKVISDVLARFGDKLSGSSVSLLVGEVAELAAGHPVLPKPKVNELFSASDIAQELGVTANKVGRIANQLGIKTDEYGEFVLDKSRYSDKQMPNFMYNARGKEKIAEFFQVVTE